MFPLDCGSAQEVSVLPPGRVVVLDMGLLGEEAVYCVGRMDSRAVRLRAGKIHT